jgi:hypothetical protein
MLLFIVLAGWFTVGVNSAIAIPITGNQTEVTLACPGLLLCSDLDVNPTGTAVMNSDNIFPVLTFPITGGDLNTATGTALILHEGSGFSLDNGTSTLLLDDFAIDTGSRTLSGDATIQAPGATPVTMEDAVLFDLVECDSITFLSFNSTGAGAFNQAFGLNNLNGFPFAFAFIDIQTGPQAVPEPGMLLLLGLGIVGLLGFRKMT